MILEKFQLSFYIQLIDRWLLIHYGCLYIYEKLKGAKNIK